MKRIPIKVEKLVPMKYKFIEWKLHNVCNYDCSFCGSIHKDGSTRWLDLDTYKNYTDKLVKLCNGQPFWIQLTGGEPTLYPKLKELMQYIHDAGGYISLISNGSRSLRYWKEISELNLIDALNLSVHCEQTNNYKHIAEIANLFHDKPTKVLCHITHTKDCIDLAFEAYDYLQENTGSFIVVKAMIIGAYDIYSEYSSDQLEKLKRSEVYGKIPNKMKSRIPAGYEFDHRMKILYDDKSIGILNAQQLLKNNMNSFENWVCEIGKDTMRIDSEIVYRGVCGVGEIRNLNDENLNFLQDSVICNAPECYCGTDLIAKKIAPQY